VNDGRVNKKFKDRKKINLILRFLMCLANVCKKIKENNMAITQLCIIDLLGGIP